MSTFPLFAHIAAVGIGATALMDGWLWLLSRLGVPSTGFAMVGVGSATSAAASSPTRRSPRPRRSGSNSAWAG